MYKYVNLSIVALQREIQFLRFTGEKKKKRWCTESWLTAELTELFSPVHPWRCISRQAFVKPTLKRQKVFQTRDSWTEEKCVAVSLDPPKPAWGAPRVWCRAQAQRYPFISSSCITGAEKHPGGAEKSPAAPSQHQAAFWRGSTFTLASQRQQIPIYITLSFQTLRSTLCSRSPPHHQWQSV